MNAASDAYRWIDANTDYMLETPDEGFDWVFMLTDHDWDLLNASWDSRTPDAREAIAYIVCESPSVQSRAILLRALRDPHRDVAVQAAQSLHSQREIDGDSFPPLDSESARLIELLVDDD